MENEMRFSVWNPRSAWLALNELFVNSPARINNAIDSAICAVASDHRKRAAARDPPGCPEFPLNAETRSGRELWRAGKRPNRIPVPIVSRAAKSVARVSTEY